MRQVAMPFGSASQLVPGARPNLKRNESLQGVKWVVNHKRAYRLYREEGPAHFRHGNITLMDRLAVRLKVRPRAHSRYRPHGT
jgi:hypothetical protein